MKTFGNTFSFCLQVENLPFNKSEKKIIRIKDDKYYEEATYDELENEFERIDEEFDRPSTRNNLAVILKALHRQRFFACWHDCSTISNASQLLITFCIVYDYALFFTEAEYLAKTGLILLLTQIFTPAKTFFHVIIERLITSILKSHKFLI